MWRIVHLVDEINRLTDLLSNRKDSATASSSRTYDEIMNAQWEQRADLARNALIEDVDRPSMLDVVTALAEQESQDHARQEHARQEHARDALINETIVSEEM